MLGVSRPSYVNVDSPNLGFPYFNFLGGTSEKTPCMLLVAVSPILLRGSFQLVQCTDRTQLSTWLLYRSDVLFFLMWYFFVNLEVSLKMKKMSLGIKLTLKLLALSSSFPWSPPWSPILPSPPRRNQPLSLLGLPAQQLPCSWEKICWKSDRSPWTSSFSSSAHPLHSTRGTPRNHCWCSHIGGCPPGRCPRMHGSASPTWSGWSSPEQRFFEGNSTWKIFTSNLRCSSSASSCMIFKSPVILIKKNLKLNFQRGEDECYNQWSVLDSLFFDWTELLITKNKIYSFNVIPYIFGHNWVWIWVGIALMLSSVLSL